MRTTVVATAFLAVGSSAVVIPHYSDALQNILQNTDGNEKYKYPTDFTREIVPVSCYSPDARVIARRRIGMIRKTSNWARLYPKRAGSRSSLVL